MTWKRSLYFLNNPARRWQIWNMEPKLISCFKKRSKSGQVSSDTKRGLIHKKSCEPLLVSLWFLVIGCHYWASIWIIFIFQGFRLSSRFVLSALDFNEADKQVVRSNLVAILHDVSSLVKIKLNLLKKAQQSKN